MHSKTVVLFDLDGTLTDPAEGITRSMAYALEQMGLAPPPLGQLTQYIGPPLAQAFGQGFGMDAGQVEAAIAHYRTRFGRVGLYENTPYPGIERLLTALAGQGKTLAVATSKPWVYAVQILEHFGLARYFAYVGGSRLDNTRTDKGEVVAHTLEQIGRPGPLTAVMVGDRHHDVAGARACGLPCVGVLYGYGSRAELEAAGAAAIAPDMAALHRILTGDEDFS